MQSRHRVIPLAPAPTDDAGELELPGELAELAGQLKREASQLATCYPAEGRDEDSLSSERGPLRRPSGRRWLWATAGAAACILLCVTLASRNGPEDSAVRANRFSRESTGSMPPAAGQLVATEATAAESTDAMDGTYRRAVLEEESTVIEGIGPAAFLQNVSGPELEGLLDLWDGQSSPTTSVSI